jgi:hypothetical protein
MGIAGRRIANHLIPKRKEPVEKAGSNAAEAESVSYSMLIHSQPALDMVK